MQHVDKVTQHLFFWFLCYVKQDNSKLLSNNCLIMIYRFMPKCGKNISDTRTHQHFNLFGMHLSIFFLFLCL